MPRIFISHSSRNNAEALALRDWLFSHGWDDLFLDIDPNGGLLAGERWLARLEESVQRCRGVVFLVTRYWLDSRYCRMELDGAILHGRQLFPVLLEELPLADIPESLRERQLVFLPRGDQREFVVAPPPLFAVRKVLFGLPGLELLRRGLVAAGLTSFETVTFPWPQPGFELESDGKTPRRPYRGLEAIDGPDAGVYFGRDAELVRARDLLADLRSAGSRRMVVILGSSGAGKSSFLRAGLLPRLAREDRSFYTLPLVRPRDAPMWGPDGLLAALEKAGSAAGLASPATLRDDLAAGGEPFLRHLQNLRDAFSRVLGDGAPPPTLVLPLDQAEELFVRIRHAADPPDEESGLFLARLAELIARGPETLVLATIRSDNYQQLQTAEALAGISQIPFNLPPLPATEYDAVIDGPARRVKLPHGELAVDEDLKRALIEENQGADALPLLALTLQRLYLARGDRESLRKADYDTLGGVRGSIEQAVAAALADPAAPPAIPAGKAEREALLKRAFVPHLIGINEVTGKGVRRTARRADLPRAADALVERLVDHRLLVADSPSVPAGAATEARVEIAHEALLRHWPSLRIWLDQEAGALRTEQEVYRASRAWTRNLKDPAWLDHRGDRLDDAERLARREDFASSFRGDPGDYLAACRQAEIAARDQERQRLERQRKQQRRIGILLAAVALVTAAVAWQTVARQREVSIQRSSLLAASAKAASDAGRFDQALRLALVASRGSWLEPSSRDALFQLGRAASASQVEAILTGDGSGLTQAQFSADGRLVVTASKAGSIHVWKADPGGTWGSVQLAGRDGAITTLGLAPDGRAIVAGTESGGVTIWTKEAGGWTSAELGRHDEVVYAATFSPDGQRIATASQDGKAGLWRRQEGSWQAEERLVHDSPLSLAIFSPDGSLLVCGSKWGRFPIWALDTEPPLKMAVESPGGTQIEALAFSPDGSRLFVASQGGIRLHRRDERGLWSEIARAESSEDLSSAAFTPDRSWIVSTGIYKESPLKVWRAREDAFEMTGAFEPGDSPLSLAVSSPDGRRLAAASEGNSAWVLSNGRDIPPQRLQLAGHRAEMTSLAFSPDGSRILTASADGTARIWRPPQALEISSRTWAGGVFQHLVAYSAEGLRILVANGKKLRIATFQAGRWTQSDLPGEFEPPRHAEFSADGSVLVWLEWDGPARAFSREEDGGWAAAVLGEGGSRPGWVFLSPDGQVILTSAKEGLPRLWSLKPEGGWAFRELEGKPGPVYSADFSADGTRMAIVSGGEAHLFELGPAGISQVASFEAPSEKIGRVELSPSGASLIAFSSIVPRNGVWLFSRGAGRVWSRTFFGNHLSNVQGAVYSPDEKYVATWAADATLRVYSYGEQGSWSDSLLAGHREELSFVQFSPDGTRLITASDEGVVRIWSLGESGSWNHIELAGTVEIRDGALSPDGVELATATEETVDVWTLRWLQGPGDWVRNEGLPLAEKACREKLHGSRVAGKDSKGNEVQFIAERLLTPAEVEAAPILRENLGEDVCASFLEPQSWWTRFAFWR